MYKLFIDDERFPITDDWVIARSSVEAIDILKQLGCPKEIAFDHDLGGHDTTRPVVNWIMDSILDGNFKLRSDFGYSIHSQNPIGRKWIALAMDEIMEHEGLL